MIYTPIKYFKSQLGAQGGGGGCGSGTHSRLRGGVVTRQARLVGGTPQQRRRRRRMPRIAPRTHTFRQPTAHCRTTPPAPPDVRARFTLCGGMAADLADGDQTAVTVHLLGGRVRGGGGGLCCGGVAIRGGVAVRGG
ncbi:hypothetical protein BU14_0103s0032, partial [Porphyra umbilicalis]